MKTLEDEAFEELERRNLLKSPQITQQDIVYRLQTRAEIRRQIVTRKSVQEGQPDRIADLLEEAAAEITRLRLNNDL
jgi:hypothetical protein